MKEVRTMEIRAEATADAKTLILRGRAVVFDMPTVIKDVFGSYTEIIRAGALDGCDLSDVRLLYNHDTNKVPLARTPKTMRLTLSAAGLDFEAELPNTEEARSVYEAVQRGDLSGCSFAMVVPEGGDNYDAETNTRTIYNITKILECSVVPFPAYQTTSVEARSARAEKQKSYKAKQQVIITCNKILLKEV